MNRTVLRSSEFWVAIAGILGQLGAMVGLWSQDDFNKVILPMLVYIIGRLISKIAKTVVT